MEETSPSDHNVQQLAGRSAARMAREDHHERRLRRRYELDLDMRYNLLRKDSAVSAKVHDMNSRAICFMGREILAPGTMLELAIDWPVLLFGTRALQLKIRGSVVRSGGHGTAVSIMWYEFRTRQTQIAPQSV